MVLYEIMATTSIALALAIPVFMEKVMRPRYEERFEDFRKLLKKNFMSKMANALEAMTKSEDDITPDNFDVMESLFSEWNDVKTNYNKLKGYLGQRKFYFGFWMVSFILSLSSCEYPSIPLLLGYNLGQVSLIIFFVVLIISGWYVWQLFELDEQLIEYKKK